MWIFPRFPNPVLCIVESCMGFPQPAELALCSLGLVSTCFSSAGLPSMLRDLCALLLAPQTHSLHHEYRVGCRGLYDTTLLAHCDYPLHCKSCACCRILFVLFSWPPGASSASTGFCVLQRFLCMPFSAPWVALCTAGILRASVGFLSPPPGWGHSL